MDIRGHLTNLDIGWTNAAFAIGAAVLSFILIHGAVVLFRRRIGALSDEQAHQPIADVLRHTLARTSNLAILATSILIGVSVLDLPPPWDVRVGHLWFLTLGAQLALWLHRAIAITARRYFRVHGRGMEDQQVTVAHTLMIWALQWSVWTVFLLSMLSNLGINVTTFVASLGIGGIAVALAVQNVLGDLFASLSIAIDKPFEVGDSISVPDFSGTVEHVGLKTTRVRAQAGEQIVIANAELLKKVVHNFKRQSTRRVQYALRINPSTAPELAAALAERLGAIIAAKDKVKFDHVNLTRMDQSFIEYDIVYNLTDADYKLFLQTQQAVLLDTMRLLRDLGISSAPRAQELLVQGNASNDADGASAAEARSTVVRPAP
ncbi:mechanosensitive ion channel [Massilia forsythiae]|uniref:Mechanosensitive ion channel n=1 Tax=Massilia forsythiae TaxID=2728020 RepID=A0A7Z2VZF2_9BURK|nr:mechanosensitive ion channel domain-containing protein [Massilia forsythiae]QJE02251.1 mechanosensitive ion channel [Massilia forsythiae]